MMSVDIATGIFSMSRIQETVKVSPFLLTCFELGSRFITFKYTKLIKLSQYYLKFSCFHLASRYHLAFLRIKEAAGHWKDTLPEY